MTSQTPCKYRVYLHSQPSPAWTFYQGAVRVHAEDEEQAQDRARAELRRGAFPDRPASSWVIERVERIS